jgi:hypothetical protein
MCLAYCKNVKVYAFRQPWKYSTVVPGMDEEQYGRFVTFLQRRGRSRIRVFSFIVLRCWVLGAGTISDLYDDRSRRSDAR